MLTGIVSYAKLLHRKMTSRAATPTIPIAGHGESDLGRLAADLRLVVGRLSRRLRQHGESGVTASLLSALWAIERLQPVALGDLADAERVQPPTLTRIVGKLEEKRLVVREGEPTDRRVSRVRLTADGHRLLDRTRSLRTAYLARRLRSVTSRDRQVLRSAVEILTRVLEESDPG